MKRPRKKRMIELIDEAKGNLTAIADGSGVSRMSVYTWVKYHDLKEHVQNWRDVMVDVAESNLAHHLEQKDWKATEFALRTLGRDRGYVERVEQMEHVEQQLFDDDDNDDNGDFDDDGDDDLDDV